MGNLIKMDLRRLFISKVFYISMAVVALLNILLDGGSYLLVKIFAAGENIAAPELSDLIISPFSISLLLVALFISVVNFTYADIAFGYIKNIAGQIPRKSDTIISKYIVLGVHNLIFMLVGVCSAILGTAIGGAFAGVAIKVDAPHYLAAAVATLLIKWLLIMAMSAIIMLVTVGVKNKSLASVVGVFLGTGALALVYLGLNTGIANIFKKSVNVANFVPDQLFGSVNVATNSYVTNAVIVAIICIVLFMTLTVKLFNSRDVK